MLSFFPLTRLLPAILTLTLMLAAGCAPQIGAECASDNECPSGARCDLSVEGGLCTVRDCRPGECPEDATCVVIDRHTSFCLKSCESDDACRKGHRCYEAGEQAETDYCFSAD